MLVRSFLSEPQTQSTLAVSETYAPDSLEAQFKDYREILVAMVIEAGEYELADGLQGDTTLVIDRDTMVQTRYGEVGDLTQVIRLSRKEFPGLFSMWDEILEERQKPLTKTINY